MGSKKLELKWRSKIIIVIEPAKTGIEIIRRIEVRKRENKNKGKEKKIKSKNMKLEKE